LLCSSTPSCLLVCHLTWPGFWQSSCQLPRLSPRLFAGLRPPQSVLLIKGRAITAALGLLGWMQQAGLVPDVFTYSAAISACEWQQALAFLACMRQSGHLPDVISYNAALSACEKGNNGSRHLLFWRFCCSLVTCLTVSVTTLRSVLARRVSSGSRHLVFWRCCSSLVSYRMSSPTLLPSLHVSRESNGSRHWVC
jgi:hypothetical protein